MFRVYSRSYSLSYSRSAVTWRWKQLRERLPNICLQVRKSEVCSQRATEQGTTLTPTVNHHRRRTKWRRWEVWHFFNRLKHERKKKQVHRRTQTVSGFWSANRRRKSRTTERENLRPSAWVLSFSSVSYLSYLSYLSVCQSHMDKLRLQGPKQSQGQGPDQAQKQEKTKPSLHVTLLGTCFVWTTIHRSFY